jgi:putative addiction module component (TIGR02574 family)
MTKSQLRLEALDLPVEERLELAEALWESVEVTAQQPPLPDWQRQILDERIAADDENPEAGSPWQEVKQRILSSL